MIKSSSLVLPIQHASDQNSQYQLTLHQPTIDNHLSIPTSVLSGWYIHYHPPPPHFHHIMVVYIHFAISVKCRIHGGSFYYGVAMYPGLDVSTLSLSMTSIFFTFQYCLG